MARVELPLVLTALCLTMTSSDPGDLRPRTPLAAGFPVPAGRLLAVTPHPAGRVAVRPFPAVMTVHRRVALGSAVASARVDRVVRPNVPVRGHPASSPAVM